ncbi:hypothetical protein [Erwinia sp. 198]|uniref:hypothetical protein n=1 Tax=Erwinia sp. 198 TaxID=2022746 RepID=UPI000F6780EA|nr:hypothetical protein [Erwinia sp. 198]
MKHCLRGNNVAALSDESGAVNFVVLPETTWLFSALIATDRPSTPGRKRWLFSEDAPVVTVTAVSTDLIWLMMRESGLVQVIFIAIVSDALSIALSLIISPELNNSDAAWLIA